jgi:hypothetical protein
VGRVRSEGTTRGMLAWYQTVPRCRRCKKVYLIRSERRQEGVCARCARLEASP